MPSNQSDWDAKHRLVAEALPPSRRVSSANSCRCCRLARRWTLLRHGKACTVSCLPGPARHGGRFFRRCSDIWEARARGMVSSAPQGKPP